MGKRISAIAVYLLIVSSCLFANDPRQAILGRYVDDENDIVLNPALAIGYGSFAALNINQVGGESWAMANVMLKDDFAVGIHLGRRDGELFSMLADSLGAPLPEGGVGLFVTKGIQLEKTEQAQSQFPNDEIKTTRYKGTFGLGFYATAADETFMETLDSDTYSRDNSSHIFSFVGGYTNSWMSLQVGTGFSRIVLDQDHIYHEYEASDQFNNSDFFTKLRVFHTLANSSRLTGQVEYSRNSTTLDIFYDADNLGTSEYEDSYELSAGIAWQRPLLEKGLLVTGLTFSMYREERPFLGGSTPESRPDPDKDNRYRIPSIKLGIEIPVVDRTIGKTERPMLLMLRSGAEKTLEYTVNAEQNEYAYVTTKTLAFSSDDDFIALGLGLKLAGLNVDFMVSDDLIQGESGLFKGDKITTNFAIGYSF